MVSPYLKMNIIIRKETAADIDEISRVTTVAFMSLQISNHTEQHIIKALRSAGALTLSLVAEVDHRVVGHIAFSPVTISDGSRDWYGLGPIAVVPEYQKQGIGTALIQNGLAMVKELGGQGCALVGDPDYYHRFGFRNDPRLIHVGIPQEYFLILPFGDHVPAGVVVFHQGFTAND